MVKALNDGQATPLTTLWEIQVKAASKYHPAAWAEVLPRDFDPDSEFPEVLPEGTAYAIGDFQKHGSNIFDLAPELVTLFKKTSVDDIIIEDINLPYETFYIHIGEEAGIVVPEWAQDDDLGIPIEGAYVSRSTHSVRGLDEGSLIIDFVPGFADGCAEHGMSYSLMFEFHQGKDGYYQTGKKTPIIEAYKRQFENPFLIMSEDEWQSMQAADPSHVRPTKTLQQVRDDWRPDEDHLLWRATAPELLKIVINAILFLTYEKDDVVLDYPAYTPAKLMAKAKKGDTKEAKRSQSKLQSMGYRKVAFVGRKTASAYRKSLSERGVLTHWRRGHWRRQPYGTRGSGLRKLVWMKPVLVNASGDDLIPGHVYETQSPAGRKINSNERRSKQNS